MRDCFEPRVKIDFEGEYQILIVNGHVFYIINKFIKFMQEYKIVYLCLSTYLTYLL